MARRSEHSKEELKILAIDAAIELIEENGFSNFSARAVAAKIGYTVGTIYHLFGTLDDFILHINAATLDMWYASLEKGLKRQKGDAIHYLAKAYVQFAHKHYERWTALFEHHQQEDKQLPDWYVPKMTRFFALVENALLSHVDGDHAKAGRMGKVLWASIHGVSVLALSGKLEIVGAESAESLIAVLVDNTLLGLKHG